MKNVKSLVHLVFLCAKSINSILDMVTMIIYFKKEECMCLKSSDFGIVEI
uniref:Uncharacterized protein n=1 Tax=Kalanchoe fedtschenkoi TaxID=63787 RepID=A0A7N0UBE7_KALFE